MSEGRIPDQENDAQPPQQGVDQSSSTENDPLDPFGLGLTRLLQRLAERLFERTNRPAGDTSSSSQASDASSDSDSQTSTGGDDSEASTASPSEEPSPPPRLARHMMQVYVFESIATPSRTSSDPSESTARPDSAGDESSAEGSSSNSEAGPSAAGGSRPRQRLTPGRLIYTVEFSLGGGGPFSSLFNSEANFQDLLDRLARAYEPRGPPPASKDAIDRLDELEITEQLIQRAAKCTVCCDEFEVGGGVALDLPCHHVFHKECITTWIVQHNTCPVCRYELPVDDPEYERDRRQRMAERGFFEDADRPEKRARMGESPSTGADAADAADCAADS